MYAHNFRVTAPNWIIAFFCVRYWQDFYLRKKYVWNSPGPLEININTLYQKKTIKLTYQWRQLQSIWNIRACSVTKTWYYVCSVSVFRWIDKFCAPLPHRHCWDEPREPRLYSNGKQWSLFWNRRHFPLYRLFWYIFE